MKQQIVNVLTGALGFAAMDCACVVWKTGRLGLVPLFTGRGFAVAGLELLAFLLIGVSSRLWEK